ncbi:unnamed protein product [Ambrosiozyma monospora]|uniref:Unnamed protein product n=1 Tax=Ambrosiozyma monospora TaxID=43982 RepID=A0A9W7DCP1_AMBMO|nr:unnamed protein product [Ambrosiozyma monospora]
MFHTPPTKDSWSSGTAIKNSYLADQPESISSANSQPSSSPSSTMRSDIGDTRSIHSETSTSLLDSSDKKPETTSINDDLGDDAHPPLTNPETIRKESSSTSTTNNNNDPATNAILLSQDSPLSTFNNDLDHPQLLDHENRHEKMDSSLVTCTEINDVDDSDTAIKDDVIQKQTSHETENAKEEEEAEEDVDDDIPLLEESFQQISETYMPFELLREYQAFIKFLREPRFAKPLATVEIADLFQGFFKVFNKRAVEFVNDENIIELKEMDKPEGNLLYKYNLLAERLLCDKFYSSIMFPTKNLPSDELLKQMNFQFSQKLSILNGLNITLSHLDVDLDIDETVLVSKLESDLLPDFELFTAERSPTLKVKYLYKLHKILTKIIKQCSSCKPSEVNTDILLPVFIYSVIKLEDLTTHSLVSQLQFIKRFSNEYVFSGNSDMDHERGQLLYVLANFEACISYIAGVTLENLKVDFFPEGTSEAIRTQQPIPQVLTVPIPIEKIDEQVNKRRDALKYPPSAPTFSIEQRKVSFSDFTPSISADQGIRNISHAVDSSLKNIMGKVSWLSQSVDKLPVSSDDSLPAALKKQLEENLIVQENKLDEPREHKLTPTSSISTSDSGGNNSTSSNGNGHTKTYSASSLNLIPENDVRKVPEPIAATGHPLQVDLASPNAQDKFLNKFTNSVGGVMKNFRPISTSSSMTSLSTVDNSNNNNMSNTNSGSINGINSNNVPTVPFPGATGYKIRSRATSLMNTSLFGGSNQTVVPGPNGTSSAGAPGAREHRQSYSLLNSLENALDTVRNRSRGSSLSDAQQQLQSQQQQQQQLLNGKSTIGSSALSECCSAETKNDVDDEWVTEASKFKKFEKDFDEMSIADLKELHKNYQFIMNNLSK